MFLVDISADSFFLHVLGNCFTKKNIFKRKVSQVSSPLEIVNLFSSHKQVERDFLVLHAGAPIVLYLHMMYCFFSFFMANLYERCNSHIPSICVQDGDKYKLDQE